ncbi:MAG: RluA family pseudouridine synthase [Syntrophaceae bacterium]|nr:RluA family pseudouridine synthase [Syntrophaceae bacterium]
MNRRPPESQVPSCLVVPDDVAPDRADRLLADLLFGVMTRSSLSHLLKDGFITWEGKQVKPSTTLKPGQEVVIDFESRRELPAVSIGTKSQPVIIFEDDHVIVLDKPAGLVVHPGAGPRFQTLMDILVESRPSMVGIGESGRWGIVHRLDKDTSGVMVVAKTLIAHEDLSAQFRRHSIGRVYLALVRGNPGLDSGVVDKELGRSRSDRKKISTVTQKGRQATTLWKVQQRYGPVSLVEIRPQTGRTHQIRVHLASIGLPILGDQVYGTRVRKLASGDKIFRMLTAILKRQALHAAVLAFNHPVSGRLIEFSSDLPSDIQEAIRICVTISKIEGECDL